jgi:hypothetical protein
VSAEVEVSVWIASLMGPVILALGLFMVTSPAALQQTTRRFLSDAPLILISGILAMVAGLAIVNTHNVWRLEWSLIVTFFGWVLLVGGAFRVIAPHLVQKAGEAMVDRAGITRLAGVVWWLLGVFLTIKGYF